MQRGRPWGCTKFERFKEEVNENCNEEEEQATKMNAFKSKTISNESKLRNKPKKNEIK